MSNSVPLTIQTSLAPGYESIIVIGSDQLSIDPSPGNLYWIIILDHSDLSVKENFVFSDNAKVPHQLKPYLNNPHYIMILCTHALNSANLPQGNLYKFLVSEGAGQHLNRAEQIYEALNCGTWSKMAYAFVAVLGSDSTGFEFFDIMDNAMISTLQFKAVEVDGQTIYTPVVL